MSKNLSLVSIAIVLMTAAGRAGIINVPGDYQTIQMAINSSMTADTILVDPGTYNENIVNEGHDVILASRFLIDEDPSYIASTIINANQAGIALTIENVEGQFAAVIGFTIQSGLTYDNGGGINCINSNLIIAHNAIIANIALVYGGGIYCYGSEVTISNNVIVFNVGRYVAGHGGAICCFESNSTITNNTLTMNASDFGGGIYLDGGVSEVTNCVIYNNLAPVGSQIFLGTGDHYFSYCDIQDGWPGDGIITDDPLLKSDGYRLMSSECGDNVDSPCIDAGDPQIQDYLLDCSWGLGTERSDIGAYGGGGEIFTAIDENEFVLPKNLHLFGNFPNPFNSSTIIKFQLSDESEINMEIYDILGQKIRTIDLGHQSPGIHEITWHADDLPSGVYFYRLMGSGTDEVARMTLLK